MTLRLGAALLLSLAVGTDALAARQTDSAATLYTRALARERGLRDSANNATLQQMRALVRSYENVVLRYPVSGYSDNALWQGAQMALLAYERFGQASDRQTAVRLLTHLREQYPSSSLVARVDAARRDIESARHVSPAVATPPVVESARTERPAAVEKTASTDAGVVSLRDIRRTTLPDGVRVSIEMDGEASYHAERIDGPPRVFFDLKNVRPVMRLRDSTLRFSNDVVGEIRLGSHPQNTTRIAIDLAGVESYSAFTLYDPFRLVIDFKAAAGPTQPSDPTPVALPPDQLSPTQAPPPPPAAPTASITAADIPIEPRPLPSRAVASPALTPPAVPAANADGKFSLARQLGLGVSRIVIDAGHGGHDPGAQADGINESELVLDVAQRLSQLLKKQTPIDVVMTRDGDVFIPLEERTGIANREGADLFLSIHANASRNKSARGVETYFLNFASNPEAEAVAARENSASGRTMHSLPDIVKAIALNNKIDESRDFADMVQRSMVRRLSARNSQLKDLGVKQAPFVVLIGAAMPSVLAEISFVTHRQEGQLLKSGAYRQQIAQALYDAVLRYQQSLKKMKSAGTQAGAR